MEHSHIFPVLTSNGSAGSQGQPAEEGPQGCPLGPLPVIYYSVLLCLGLPGKLQMTFFVCVSVCVRVCV